VVGAGQDKASSLRVAPGRPKDSLVLSRMISRQKEVQMPPLGTHTVDAKGVALIQAWIEGMDSAPQQAQDTP